MIFFSKKEDLAILRDEMETDKIDTIGKLTKLKGIEKTPSLDRIAFSNEAEKIEHFVEMLKQMPEIRDEALGCSATPDPKKIANALLGTV
ncbi:MAG: hypothetical protein S4CHLAM45_06070 [Chlamydiales bacterium]|nr:hypothetical protein [Chlamydiales bacterium]MCH9619853.1 hypothetical protein [Chlamydiales bacterium]MCH9622720.1 hypothetical protein [Chlamydiales bacterium]